LWADFTNHFGVFDLVMSGSRNIRVLDGMEGIRAFDTLFAWARGMLADTLAEATELIGIRSVPHVLVFWMTAELATFKRFAGVLVQDWKGLAGVVVGLQEGSVGG
jgi:hypothetical protein